MWIIDGLLLCGAALVAVAVPILLLAGWGCLLGRVNYL